MLKAKIRRSLQGFELNVNISLGREIMTILGTSGAGKTMTLQCIAGLVRPDEGRIELGGKILFDSQKRVNLPTQKRRVGFVFQNYALFPHMTVRENISYGIRHLHSAVVSKKVDSLLNMMNIGSLPNRFPKQLSAGQQQRVAIARALAPDPEILLLDEPFSALDSQLRERLELELLELQKEFGGSMLLVTHDLEEGYKLGTQIAIYHSGRIAQCGTRQQIFSAPASRTVARLTGVRNFIEGRVTRKESSDVWVRIPVWELDLRVCCKEGINAAVGDAVVVGIRPEYVRIVQDDLVDNVVNCHVLQMVEGIVDITYRFAAEKDSQPRHPLTAVLSKSNGLRLPEESWCRLSLPAEQLVLVPA